MSVLQNAIIACWVVFLAFWAVTAFTTKRTVPLQIELSRQFRSTIYDLARPTVPERPGLWG
jgi:hypothetical protein